MKHMKNLSYLTLFTAVIIQGCAAPSGPAQLSGVQYKDSSNVETLTIGFGQTDLQQMAETMIQSLLQSRIFHQDEEVILAFSSIVNQTDDRNIDVKQIAQKIRVALVNSGKVVFSNFSNDSRDEHIRKEILSQQELQQSGMVNEDTVGEKDNIHAADYFLTGEITSISKRSKGVKHLYLKLTLQLVDPVRGLTVWADEKEITKTAERPTFGW